MNQASLFVEQNRTEQNNGILSLEQSTPIICYTAIHYITMDYYQFVVIVRKTILIGKNQ